MMVNSLRALACALALAALTFTYSCSGGFTTGLEAGLDSQIESIDDTTRGTSATYVYYFRDGVGFNSLERWDLLTRTGTGAWKVWAENTLRFFRSPANANTTAELISPHFNIPANTSGIKITLKTRYTNLNSGKLQVTVNGGQSWTDLATFSGTDTTSYWGTKSARLAIPANTTTSSQTGIIRFVAETGATTNSTWDIDSIAIYRTELTLAAPVMGAVTPGPYAGTARVNWSYPAGAEKPSAYKIYVSNSATTGFALLQEFPFISSPATGKVTVVTGPGTKYYRVIAVRPGSSDSAPSAVATVAP